MLTQKRLKELLRYDPQTGDFIRLVATNHRVKVGEVAGFVDIDGYRRIRVDKKLYLAHRLAWLWVHGEFPEVELDHKNGARDDNRISELRPAERFQNSTNRASKNSTGFRGVRHDTRCGKFTSYITHRGQRQWLGTFETAEAAHAAYASAAAKLHGEFARVS